MVVPLVTFVVALSIGGPAIYLGARSILDVADYSHAIVTAVLGAVVGADLIDTVPGG